MSKLLTQLFENKYENYIFPFFWQHGESEEVIRKYMKVISEANIKAVCVESRPHPDFCGKQWWHDMDIILDEARQRNMKVWILDDSHFPTGYANGAMKDKPDELCRQSLCCQTFKVEKGQTLSLVEEIKHPAPFEKSMVEQYVLPSDIRYFDDDKLLSVYGVRTDVDRDLASRIDLSSYISDDGLLWKPSEGQWKVYVMHLSRNFGYHRDYINMMDKESCRVLIDAVYEPHFNHYGKDFGNTIAGFFSDEPELGNGHLYEVDDGFGKATDFPWSRELESRLAQEWGKDYAIYLGALWDEESGMAEEIRYAYMNAVTNLVKENFSMQIGNWCREHGVKYIGHLIEDDNHHSRTGSSLGHYYRGLAGQDMAGIDDIGGQVFPQGENVCYNNGIFNHRDGQFYHYMLGKLASSAAAIEPLKNGDSMCEIFGNYGWSEGVRLEKYLADHFMVRGINHFVPHAFSGKSYPDPDCPPHFYAHGNNPQYRHFGYLMSYMNRVCHLISGGIHIAKVAVLYHGEGEWTGKYMTADNIGHILADSQIDYDYIPQDVFSFPQEYKTIVHDGKLTVNTQDYQAVVIPYMQFITIELAQALNKLAYNNIKVLFMDKQPEGFCNGTSAKAEQSKMALVDNIPVVKLKDLTAYLYKWNIPEIVFQPANNYLRYLHYKHESGENVWLFVNEGTDIYEGKLIFSEGDIHAERFYEYDAWENCLREVSMENGNLIISIEPLKSFILIDNINLDADTIKAHLKKEIKPASLGKNIKFINQWKRSICRSIEYPEFKEETNITLPDCLALTNPDFSGFCRYENAFYGKEGDKLLLVIDDAYEGMEVFLNGNTLGIQIVPPFRYDISPYVINGINELTIEVATTLERENAKIPNEMGQTIEPISQSGITGNITIYNFFV